MSQRITPIFLTGFKGIYKAGPAITCPPDMLVECQNAIVQDGAVKKPREEITNAAYTGLSTLDAYSMCFLGNAVASTKAFKIVIGGTVLFGENTNDTNFKQLQIARNTITFGNVANAYDKAYIFDNANQPQYWDYAAATSTALTTPPSEICADVVFHQGRLFALRAATNKDYLFISETNGDIFKTAWIIRTPSNRTGFTAIREFSINDDFLIILTDLCPTILTGNGINNFSLNAKKQYPGMRSNAPRCACLGIRGVYYLDNYMDITRFEGESAYNICRDTLGEYLRNDVKNSALDVSCMWADGRYVYFSYVSNEVSSSATAPNRILIYDENTQQWVGDLRLGTSTPSYVCPTFKRSLMLAYSFITVTPAATTASLLAKSNTPSTSVTSVIQTKEVTINPRNISDFDVIESVFDVANSGSNAVTADVSIDGTFLALNKSISLLTSGPRYGDEDGTTINRVGLIHYPWILDAKQCSGRRMGIKFTHSGYRDVTDFTLRYVMIDSFLSQIDEDKERIK